MGKIKAGRHVIETSKEDKVFFPGDGGTKGDLIGYYKDIAETMLYYLKDRPLTMHRYPDGIKKEDFYQKEVPDYFPKWITTAKIKLKGDGGQKQVVCNNTATLIYITDQACITPHTWLSKKDKLSHPDRLIFDLDPSDNEFSKVRKAARKLKDILEEIGLTPFVMTTGSRGLHVVSPLDRSANFDRVREIAKQISKALVEKYPEDLTTQSRKNKRGGRIFLDYLRNAYGQTSVPPYAVRAKPGAPVATPLNWDEIGSSKLDPQSYNIKNIFKRLGRKDDPWKGIGKRASSISKAAKMLEK